MPRPTPQDRHVDGVLSNVGMAFLQDPNAYVATKMFPFAGVPKQSDLYRKYSLAGLLRLRAQKMNPGTAAPIDTTGFADEQYFCEKYGLRDFLTPEGVANDDGPIPPDQMVTLQLMQAQMTTLELDFAQKFFANGIWDNNLEGVAAGPAAGQFVRWDLAGSDPVADVMAARRAMHDDTGFFPNRMTIAGDVMDALQTNAAIQDRIKYTGSRDGAIVTAQMLAGLFKVEQIFEGEAISNTAAEGAAAVMANVFAGGVLMAYAAPNPNPRVPSAGYTFHWTTPTDSPGTSVVVRRIPRPSLGNRTDFETIMYYDQKMTASNLGVFLRTVITP